MHVGGAPGSGKTYLGKVLKSQYKDLKVIDTDMLRSCNINAGSYEKPQNWAKRAAPYILNITQKDNGASLTIT